MAKEPEPRNEWREPTPGSSDEESSYGSTSYESEPLTPRPQKKRRGEEEDDPDFNPKGETQGPRVLSPD